jgi:hypothetical protein
MNETTSSIERVLWQAALWVAGALVYANLFWQEYLGLNTLLFGLFALLYAFWQFPSLRYHRRFHLLAGSVLLSAIFVVWHATFVAKLTHLLAMLLFIGQLNERPLRFAAFGLLLGFWKLFSGPIAALQSWNKQSQAGTLTRILSLSRLALLPLGLGILFASIYYHANPHFAGFVDRFMPENLFHIQGGQFFRWILGLFIVGALGTSAMGLDKVRSLEGRLPEQLQRKQPKWWSFRSGTMALKQEYQNAIFTLGVLNALLFVANVADLRFVWVEYGKALPHELSQYVREGTFLLIYAILLAMVVLLWFFRGNLNFFPENDKLRWLAHLWLAQNVMLALSVFLRNWQYVSQYGLAYKRIGVFVFLLLVLSGLGIVHQKIQRSKALMYVVERNVWAVVTVLLLASSLNWTGIITRYNLRQAEPGALDGYFLFHEMPAHNYQLLMEHKAEVQRGTGWTQSELEAEYNDKKWQVQERLFDRTWRSWAWVYHPYWRGQ